MSEVELKTGTKHMTSGLESDLHPAEKLGSFLQRVRVEQGLSQLQLAILTEGHGAKVSRSEISALERGKRFPRLDNLLSLSNALRLNPVEILDRLQLTNTASIDLTGLTYDELMQQADDFFWAGRYDEDLAALDAMKDILVLDPPKDTDKKNECFAYIELRRSGTLRRCGALLAAREAAERAICSSAKWPEIQAQAYMVLSTVYLRTAHYQLAIDTIERSATVGEDCKDPIRGKVLIAKGRTLLAIGHFHEARDTFVEARELIRNSSDTHHLTHIEGNIGSCDFLLEKYRKAEHWMLRAIKQAKLHDMPVDESTWLINLGNVLCKEEDFQRADQYALQGLSIARRLVNWLLIFRGEWLRHKVVRLSEPERDGLHRIALLRKLHSRLREHRDEDDLQEFEHTYVQENPQNRKARRSK